MNFLACTLLADGTSDRVLKPILDWLLDVHCPQLPQEVQFAQDLPGKPKGLPARIKTALVEYPCDMLFVHRDAEACTPEEREQEIEAAWQSLSLKQQMVSVIPVRMTEAWLLLDKAAIRAAAGNPSGAIALKLPALSKLESLKDPKQELFDLLRAASGLAPGRLSAFSAAARRHRVAELITSFEPLRALPSFRRLEAQLQRAFQT
jgi:hypothetical protein